MMQILSVVSFAMLTTASSVRAHGISQEKLCVTTTVPCLLKSDSLESTPSVRLITKRSARPSLTSPRFAPIQEIWKRIFANSTQKSAWRTCLSTSLVQKISTTVWLLTSTGTYVFHSLIFAWKIFPGHSQLD